jgi:hypothetical protein
MRFNAKLMTLILGFTYKYVRKTLAPAVTYLLLYAKLNIDAAREEKLASLEGVGVASAGPEPVSALSSSSSRIKCGSFLSLSSLGLLKIEDEE